MGETSWSASCCRCCFGATPGGTTPAEGTIFYMGVLPAHRGHGHAVALLGEATRTFQAAGCSSALCDTGETNRPMVAALRRAGYRERSRWQRKVA